MKIFSLSICNRGIIHSLLISSIFISIISCKKYEEGPCVSIFSKKQRLCGQIWTIDKVYKGTKDYTNAWTSLDPNYSITYERDGTYYASWNYDISEGEWKFTSDKNYLIRNPNSGGEFKFKIISLKSDQLRLNDEADTLLFWFIPY
jgi:hypothetical protein